MKLLAGSLYVNVLLEACAASSFAQIYFSGFSGNPGFQVNDDPPSIDPLTARLLIARRLGLSQYHNLADFDGRTIDVLNKYGGNQEQLFAAGSQQHSSHKFLILIEGITNAKDIVDLDQLRPSVLIENPPSSPPNVKLVLDLLSQDRQRRVLRESRVCGFELPSSKKLQGGWNYASSVGTGCDQNRRVTELSEIDIMREFIQSERTAAGRSGSTVILHVPSLEDLCHKSERSPDSTKEAVRSLVTQLLLSPPSKSETTLILIPPSPKVTKRTASSPYGSYAMPGIQARSQAEEPLLSTSKPSSSPNSPSLQPLSSSVPLKGILPICHSSLDAAISATNNCSSHGHVYRRNSAQRDSKIECYACSCTPSVLRNKDGKVAKTTFWGGPACQKKDVSTSFWLLALVTIGLLAAVGWGIGLLAAVGGEELPSVIGAGVAGPRAQK